MEGIPRPEIWTASKPAKREPDVVANANERETATNDSKSRRKRTKKKKKKEKPKKASQEEQGNLSNTTKSCPASLTQTASGTKSKTRRARPSGGVLARVDDNQRESDRKHSPRSQKLKNTYGVKRALKISKTARSKSRGKIIINGVELPDDDGNNAVTSDNAMTAGPNDIVAAESPSSADEQQIDIDDRRIFSLTDVALPSPVRSRIQVSISKQRAAAQAAADAKAEAERNTIADAFNQSKNKQHMMTTSGGSGAAAAKALRPVSASTLATALPAHTPGRKTEKDKRANTSFLNTWFSRLEVAEQTAAEKVGEAGRLEACIGTWEQKYKELERSCQERDKEIHDRILSLQSEMLLLKNEKESLLNDMDECHAARREDAELHSREQEKWKRREASLESARHEAMVAANLHKSRLDDQKNATQAAIEMNKQTKETLGKEIARLRKMLAHDDKVAEAKHKMEIQRLEREVARLKNEVTRVRSKTKSNVAAAAAAAASAAFEGMVNGGNKNKLVGSSKDKGRATVDEKVEPKAKEPRTAANGKKNAVQSSKARIAAAEQRIMALTSKLVAAEKRAAVAEERQNSAEREAESTGNFLRRKTEELQKEIELLHAKLQERKRELEEAQRHNKDQGKQWLEVQKTIADDAKARRELGHLVSSTEKKAREACQRADRSDNALERELERHERTKKDMEATKDRVAKLTSELEKRTETCNELVAVSKDAAREKAEAEAALASLKIELTSSQKNCSHLEEAAKEQKELLAVSTRTIRSLEQNIKRIQTSHREEIAECKAQVQLAKSKTISVIDAKREMGLRYQKCVAARKELELRLEKEKHDQAQLQRMFDSEKQTLERRLRGLKEKTQRESHVELAKMAKALEAAKSSASEEREAHEVTHRALRSAHVELDELNTRLAEAEAESERLAAERTRGFVGIGSDSHAANISSAHEWGSGSGQSPIESSFFASQNNQRSFAARSEHGVAKAPGAEETGRPPRPPAQSSSSAGESDGNDEHTTHYQGAAEPETHLTVEPHSRQEDSALLSVPSSFERQHPRVEGILQQHSSFLEEPSLDSPGKRAAAVIMGATDFVRRRSAKRKSRKQRGIGR